MATIPLGRNFYENPSSKIWTSCISQRSINQLKGLGIVPINKLIKNERILSQKPVQATQILLTKLWIKFKEFWLDPSLYFLEQMLSFILIFYLMEFIDLECPLFR